MNDFERLLYERRNRVQIGKQVGMSGDALVGLNVDKYEPRGRNRGPCSNFSYLS